MWKHTHAHTGTMISPSTPLVPAFLAKHLSITSTSGIKMIPNKYFVRTYQLPLWCCACFFPSLLCQCDEWALPHFFWTWSPQCYREWRTTCQIQSNQSLPFSKDVEKNVTRWTIYRGGADSIVIYEPTLMFESSHINIILFLFSGFLLVFAKARGYRALLLCRILLMSVQIEILFLVVQKRGLFVF